MSGWGRTAARALRPGPGSSRPVQLSPPPAGLTHRAADVALRFSRRALCTFIVRQEPAKLEPLPSHAGKKTEQMAPPQDTRPAKKMQGWMREQTDID